MKCSLFIMNYMCDVHFNGERAVSIKFIRTFRDSIDSCNLIQCKTATRLWRNCNAFEFIHSEKKKSNKILTHKRELRKDKGKRTMWRHDDMPSFKLISFRASNATFSSFLHPQIDDIFQKTPFQWEIYRLFDWMKENLRRIYFNHI